MAHSYWLNQQFRIQSLNSCTCDIHDMDENDLTNTMDENIIVS